MHLQVQEGGAAAVNVNDWTIFPIGWPGPDICFGVVRSVGTKSAMVYDIFFDMDIEFMLDKVEVLTQERMSHLSPSEMNTLKRAQRQLVAGSSERIAA